MASTLFPLFYNSGVQRDGTTFQPMYCTDAQWVRFQRDKIKKIGGMKGIDLERPVIAATNLKIYPTNEQGEILTFIGHSTGINVINSNSNWVSTLALRLLILAAGGVYTDLMWESETVIDSGKRDGTPDNLPTSYILFMKTNNLTNINQNTPSDFYLQEINKALVQNEGDIKKRPLLGVSPLINGNLCFAAPYLFLFGSNGLVQYSSETNPFDFEQGGEFIAASDKIIYGRAIRGGPNVPSLLLWSLSSVVRVTNTGLDNQNKVLFKPETISNGSSILSSRCVVEYDGFFFWPGTDRFYVYNGIVDELPNKLNLNYFFDNIDMNRRQQVFGVKNAKYGEIWWFYPVKGVPGANSRAIVYNKRENFWYDTAISREAGAFSNDFGFMATYGHPLTNNDNVGYLWRHEFNTIQEKGRANIPPGGAPPVLEPISSYFVSPIFSWVAFPPNVSKQSKPAQLLNRWVELERIEPDFVDTANPSHFTVQVSTKEYAQSKSQTFAPIAFDSDTEKLDMRVQGRNMSLKFASEEKFEVGQIMLLLGIGDAR